MMKLLFDCMAAFRLSKGRSCRGNGRKIDSTVLYHNSGKRDFGKSFKMLEVTPFSLGREDLDIARRDTDTI